MIVECFSSTVLSGSDGVRLYVMHFRSLLTCLWTTTCETKRFLTTIYSIVQDIVTPFHVRVDFILPALTSFKFRNPTIAL